MVTNIFKARRSRARSAAMQKPNPAQWLENAQLALGWAIVLTIIAIASGIYLREVSRTAIVGNNASVLQRRLAYVRDENASIRQAIASEQSIIRIKERAAALDLPFRPTDPATIEYITVVVPAVKAPVAPVAEQLKIPPETIQAALLIEVERVLLTVEGVFGGR